LIHGYSWYILWYIPAEEATMSQLAKIFKNGRSQAVRLPQAFRFDEDEVFIHKDVKTGDVILSRKPGDWVSFFGALEVAEVPADFLSKSDRGRTKPDKDHFEDYAE
jgi:antitoxin VapB